MINKIKKILKSISYLTTLLVTLIGLYTFFSQLYIDNYGAEDDNLQVLNVKFKPNISFFDKTSGFYGDSNIIITVKNFGDKTIRLTSDEIEIKGNKTLISQCSGMGINTLSSNPKKSAIIKVLPGEEKQFFLSKSISLKTITSYLNNENNLSKTFVSKFDNDYLLHDLRIEEKLIKYMKKNFSDVSINIKLYTGYKKIIKDHTITFDGGSIFDTDGKIHYNSFLANLAAIKQGKKRYGF